MTNKNPIRWVQRLENYSKAVKRLTDAAQQGEYTDLERAGLIQIFEFTFELAWKTLKDILDYEGFDVASPRSVIRTSLEANYITSDECEQLLSALGKRNLLAHTYDENTSLEAERLIVEEYQPLMLAICQRLEVKKANDE